jgi:thiol-disulfide isomerase/thioredoxin
MIWRRTGRKPDVGPTGSLTREIQAPTDYNLKTLFSKWFALLLASMAGGSIVFAADPAVVSTNAPELTPEPMLKMGDPAPPLQTGKWVQGDPVTKLQKGTAYIVEFWATWCGPCREAIPHLNEKYLKYKDKGLVVIGQDCSEKDEGLVEPFIKRMGDKMTYRVALDDKSDGSQGKMIETWMAAAGQDGIPTAFLIDTNGIVAWIGNPMSLQDSSIDQVLAGTYDIKKGIAQMEQEQKNQLQIAKLADDLQSAMQSKDWDSATAKLDEIEKLLPESDRDIVVMPRFDVAIGKKDYPAAYKILQKTSDAHKDDAKVQSALAWKIASDPAIEQRDLALAETFATQANDLAKGSDFDVLDTLARVQFMRGKKDDAIANETKAVSLADDDAKDQIQATLDSYKKGELPKLGPPDPQ